MREILTGFAILICLALIGAMAGPHFVDWNQHRAVIERKLSEASGHPVRVQGAIALTLLPTPSLALGQVRIGPDDAAGLAMIEAERVAVALQATSLIRGDILITEAHVDRPIMRIGENGIAALRGAPPKYGTNPDAVSIARLNVYDGSLYIPRPGREAQLITDINGDIEATSLLGPAKGNATFVMEGASRHVRLALGRFEAGQMRLKLLVEDLSNAVRVDIDGAMTTGDDAGFSGSATLTANPVLLAQDKLQLPVRATAKVKADPRSLRLDDLSLTLGGEPRPMTLTGTGTIHTGPIPFVDLALKTRSYDFDGQEADGRPKPAVPAVLIRRLADIMGTAGDGAAALEGRIDLAIGGLVIGSQTVSNAHVIAEYRAGKPRLALLEGDLPGQTSIRFARDDQSGDGIVSGRLELSSRDPERLNGWFNGVQRQVTAAAAITASAILSSIPGGIAIERIEIDRGTTHLSGTGSYRLAAPAVGPAPRLALALSSTQLAIADIPAFVLMEDRKEDKPALDFEIDLDARQLLHEGRETGRLSVKARRDGALTSIERIAITDLDGSSLIASGSLGGGARRMTVKLDATRLDGIAAILERVAPGPLASALRRRAPQLQPALLVATIASEQADGTFQLSADGQLAATDVALAGTMTVRGDTTLGLDVTLASADSAALARQFTGAIAAGRNDPLPGRLSLSLKGNPRATMALSLDAALAGLTGRVAGDIRLFQPFTPFSGTIEASTPDLGPTAAAFGLDPALAPAGAPARITGTLVSRRDQIVIEDLAGRFGSAPISGELALQTGEATRLIGQLRVPSVDFGLLASVALGPLPVLTDSRGWSPASWGKPVTLPVAGDLWIEADRGTAPSGHAIDKPRFVLRFDRDSIGIEHADLKLGSGRVTGALALRRLGVAAYLTTDMTVAALPLAMLPQAALTATADGQMQLTARGESLARLVSTLSGTGALRLREATLTSFDADALPRLLVTPLDRIDPVTVPTVLRWFAAELPKQPLALGNADFGVVVIDGTVRLTGAMQMRPPLRFEPGGTLDLVRRTADLRLQVTAPSPEGWLGAPPHLISQWSGPLGSLTPSLAIDPLVNGLLAIALKLDLERAEIQEQDARERAFFNRRRRAADEERQAREDAEDRAIENARLVERNRLLEMEQARRAEERAREQARLELEAREAAERERIRLEREARETAERERLRIEKEARDAAERARLAREEAEARAARPAPPPVTAPAVIPPLPLVPPTGAPLDLRPPAAPPG